MNGHTWCYIGLFVSLYLNLIWWRPAVGRPRRTLGGRQRLVLGGGPGGLGRHGQAAVRMGWRSVRQLVQVGLQDIVLPWLLQERGDHVYRGGEGHRVRGGGPELQGDSMPIVDQERAFFQKARAAFDLKVFVYSTIVMKCIANIIFRNKIFNKKRILMNPLRNTFLVQCLYFEV